METPMFMIPELQKNRSSDKKTKFVTIVGTNGTGKSTLCAKLVERTVLAGGRALIVMPDDREWSGVSQLKEGELNRFKRIRKIVFDPESTLDVLVNYKHGLLVFDDCRAYVPSSLAAQMHELLIRRRQNDVNIIAVGHGFTEVPPKFFTFATEIVIFKTVDNILKRKDCINDWTAMAYAVQYVNKVAGEGKPHFYKVVKQ